MRYQPSLGVFRYVLPIQSMVHSVIFTLFLVSHGLHNEPLDFLIGDSSPPFGAVFIREDTPLVDLSMICGYNHCPSVLIFAAQQWGTIGLKNCVIGRVYLIINQSKMDLGIVVQEDGGMFGSKPISRFDSVTCFCSSTAYFDVDEATEHQQQSLPPRGVLLCR